jgi:hypothetical protein
MSASKFQCQSYKLFQPEHHPQRPLIVGVDDGLDSPETLSLHYEEASRLASGGDPRGDSPPRLYSMATYGKAPQPLPSMHGYDASRYSHAAYEPYQPPTYSTPPATDKFSQMNQQAFGANGAVTPTVPSYIPAGPVVHSCQPTSGGFGTKVYVRFSTQYDIFSLSSALPFFFLQFGSEKCPMNNVAPQDSQDTSGFVYTCSADTPQQLVTGSADNTVPLSLVMEGAAGEEIARTVAGSFTYMEGSGDDITRAGKMVKQDPPSVPGGPQMADHEGVSPKTGEPSLATDAGTNNYDEPTQHGPYASTGYTQGTGTNGDMISTYRSSSFTEPPFHRRSAHGWSGFHHGTLGSSLRSPLLHHTGLSGRSALGSLAMPSTHGAGTPQLVRTSTISHPGGAGPYNSVSLYATKAILKINGKLDSMAEHWTQEEWSNRRRIVLFRRSQQGSTLTANFKPVSVNERPPNSICVSCIWWAEKGKCYVTSVDTIYLLEQLVAAPNRFSVEEKNRIRRNLEGFHPVTVSKSKDESEEFFKLIMGFPNPKPRNIEKDVKVFPWEILEPALKKIIGKYSANPSNTLPPANMVAPTPYATLPTPPGQSSISSQASEHHSQYSVHSNHHDIPSPRSLSGSGPSWTPYTTAPGFPSGTSAAPSTRTISPTLRQPSPQHPPSIRVNTQHALPAVTSYDTRTVSTGGYSTGLHTPLSHHPSTSTPPRWDTTPASYASADPYPSLSTAHHTQGVQSVYSSAAAYDGGASRA